MELLPRRADSVSVLALHATCLQRAGWQRGLHQRIIHYGGHGECGSRGKGPNMEQKNACWCEGPPCPPSSLGRSRGEARKMSRKMSQQTPSSAQQAP